jgi:diguanylate cyclase (GGDEF)-like protein
VKNSEQILRVIRRQLFATVPSESKAQFKKHLFAYNVPRFAIQSIIVIIMNAVSLICYSFIYNRYNLDFPFHIPIHILSIVLNLACAIVFSRWVNRPYDDGRFFDRISDLFYPSMHFVLEFCLYMFGPQDLGAFIRLMAVPFIVGAIPLLKQVKSLALLFIIYLTYYLCIPQIPAYGEHALPVTFFVNLWGVVFSCAILVSFTVYSWFVNNFIANVRENTAQNALAELNGQLAYMSVHDMLTGLYNRRGFVQFMEETWPSHLARDTSAAVIMVDIDYFKRYNDRLGHLAGDDCLKMVAAAINESLSGTEYIVARYGGEEFIAVAYNQSHEDMVDFGERMRKRVLDMQLPHPDNEASAYVSVSVGVASCGISEHPDYSTLIGWADECLYFAKRMGRNRLIHTAGERGHYRDIHGINLISVKSEVVASREFDEEYTTRLLNDIGANCTFVFDTQRGTLRFSRPAIELFGLPGTILAHDLETISGGMHVATTDQASFVHIIRNCLRNREPSFSAEVHLQMPDTHAIPVSINAQCSYTEDGQPEIIFGAIISISKMIEYNHYLLQQSMTNSITLLPNRDKLFLDILV